MAERLASQNIGSLWTFHGFLATPRNGKPVVRSSRIFNKINFQGVRNGPFKKFNKDKRPSATPVLLFKRKRFCRFTVTGVEEIDYKDVDTCAISSPKRQDHPARLTGTRAIFQRQLNTAIKRARFLALVPYRPAQDLRSTTHANHSARKVVNLGNLGEIVKVKDGYARNFLIPPGRCPRAHRSRQGRVRSQTR